MTVVLEEDGSGTEEIQCETAVRIVDSRNHRTLEGDRAIYYPEVPEVEVFGDPLTMQDAAGNKVEGGRHFVYDLESGTSVSPPRPTPVDDAPRGRPVRLSATGLRKVYRGRAAVDGVSIEIGLGEVVGLLGPNGAGKTTTFYMVVGLTPPDEGRVLLGDEDIASLPMYLRARRGISYLPQEPSVFRKMTVEDNLRAIFQTLDLTPPERRRRTEELIQDFGLSRPPQQRLAVRRRAQARRDRARAGNQPQLPAPRRAVRGDRSDSGRGHSSIIEHLKAMGIGVLITDHNVRETLKITDRAYIINNGRILRSSDPTALADDPEVRKVYLGAEFRL